MKKSLLILFIAFFAAVSCGDDAVKRLSPASDEEKEGSQTEDQDQNPDEEADTGDTTEPTEPTDTGDTTEPTEPTDTGDTTEPTEPTDTGDTTEPTEPTDTGDTAEPTEPTDTGDTAEPTDTGDTGDDGDTLPEERTASCTGLPENAQWNTASVIMQTCVSGNCEPSAAGHYNEEPADSITDISSPEPVDPSMVPCPEGEAPQNGSCVTCGRYITKTSVEESDAGTVLLDPNKCYVSYKYNDNGKIVWEGLPRTCCCGDSTAPLYTVKNQEITPLTPPYSLSDGEMTCTVPGCSDGFIYADTTAKCYECRGGLSFDGGNAQCETEIAYECRFKCREDFTWDGSSCVDD